MTTDPIIALSQSLTVEGVTYSLTAAVSQDGLLQLSEDQAVASTVDGLLDQYPTLAEGMTQSLFQGAQVFRLNLLRAYVKTQEAQLNPNSIDTTTIDPAAQSTEGQKP